MLCSQREVQTSGILTHIERDECLRNSRSVWPTLITGRECTLCMIPQTWIFALRQQTTFIGEGALVLELFEPGVFQVLHSFSVSLGKSYYFSEQQLCHPQMEATWGQERCSVQVFCLMRNIIQIRNCCYCPNNISRSQRWKYIYFILPARTEIILQVP